MNALLTIERLQIYQAQIPLVNIANVQIKRGEILGLVGESGSGKSLTAKALLGLLPKQLTVNAVVHFDGATLDLTKRRTPTALAAIFQHPAGSFTPVVSIGSQISEVVSLHGASSYRQAKQRSLQLLSKMGLIDAERVYNAYPHQLSGGMLQRAAIAMALACNPTLLIADEPTTALDSLTQTEVLDLLKSLQAETNLSVLLISHDLPLVAQYSDSVAVMRHGQLLEQGPVKTVLSQAQHPYTEQLLFARPDISAAYDHTSRLAAEEL